MIKFSEWAEQLGLAAQAGGGLGDQMPTNQMPAVAEPQHHSGEDQMDISRVIETRLQMLIDELEKKKRIPRPQLIQILSQVMETLTGVGLNKTMANQVVKGQFAPPGPSGASATPSAQPQIAS
jgi:hypothetical protein